MYKHHTCQQLAAFCKGEAPLQVLSVLVDDEVAIFLVDLQQSTAAVNSSSQQQQSTWLTLPRVAMQACLLAWV